MEAIRELPGGIEWPRYESGELVEVGDEVVGPDYGEHIRVDEITFHANGFTLREKTGFDHWYESDDRFKRPAVIAADGEPLEAGQTVWVAENGNRFHVVWLCDDGLVQGTLNGDLMKYLRPEQLTHQRPVLDADGNRIEPAMDVWWVCEGDERGVHAEKLHVESIGEDGLVTCGPFNSGTWVELEPSELYVNRPVLDAGGVPIKKGDTVWHKATGEKYRVFRFSAIENRVWGDNNLGSFFLDCSMLTHTKPEPPDTWERIEGDTTLSPEIYCHRNGIDISQKDGTELFLAGTVKPMARDLVRRCKEVARKENNNE